MALAAIVDSSAADRAAHLLAGVDQGRGDARVSGIDTACRSIHAGGEYEPEPDTHQRCAAQDRPQVCVLAPIWVRIAIPLAAHSIPSETSSFGEILVSSNVETVVAVIMMSTVIGRNATPVSKGL